MADLALPSEALSHLNTFELFFFFFKAKEQQKKKKLMFLGVK